MWRARRCAAAISLIGMVAACGAAPAMQPMTAKGGPAVVLDEQSSGASLHVGDRLEVHLQAQLGAGWSWQPPAATGGVLRLVGSTSTRAPDGAPREGGQDLQIFTFEAIAAGDVTLAFRYTRPFVSGEPPRKRISYRIHVG